MWCQCDNRQPSLHIVLSDGMFSWMGDFRFTTNPIQYMAVGLTQLAQDIMKWIATINDVSFERDWNLELSAVCTECKQDLPIKIFGEIQTKALLEDYRGDKTKLITNVCLKLARAVLTSMSINNIILGIANFALNIPENLSPEERRKANFRYN